MKPGESTSVSLIQRVRSQEESAWNRLVDLYGPLVISWLKRWGMRSDECADLMQEIFSSVLKGIETFRKETERDTFRGWLRVIAHNEVRGYLRKQGKQPRAVGGSTAHVRMQKIDESIPDDPKTQSIERGSVYRRALDLIKTEFEDSTWKAFLACVMENRPATDIADELGMTPGGVRQAKYRVLKRLRSEFEELL